MSVFAFAGGARGSNDLKWLKDYMLHKPSPYAMHSMGRIGLGNSHPLPSATHPLDSTRNLAPVKPSDTQPHVITDTRHVDTVPWWHRMNGWKLTEHITQTVKSTPVLHPSEWPKHLWNSFGSILGYIGWSYQDLVEQFKAWDGTWQGLISHVGLWWRVIVTVFITLGILELATWMEAFAGLVRILWSALKGVFYLVVDVVEEFWRVIDRIWNDITSLFS